VFIAIPILLLIGSAEKAVAQAATRKTLALREKVYKKLSQAQQAVEAQNWTKAFKELQDVEKMKDLDAHEKAQLYNAYGYTYFAQERYQESIDAYEKVLLQENLPEALQTSTRYTLAQLWFHQENYQKAIEHLEEWLATAENPGPEPFVLLGQAYYQVGRPSDSIPYVQRAISVAQERGQPVQENWYALLRVFYHELEDYPRLLEVLEVLVTQFPKKEYWLHLASTYGEIGNTQRQLAAYEVAFAQGYLATGQEQLLLSQLLLQAEVPYRAGIILAQGLEDGLIEGTAQNWRLLSQAWILAHEHQRAIAALTKAAALSNDGELDARIAQSYANLDDWENTISAARVALRKGVRNAHELEIMIGMALFELGRFDEARTAFAAAQKSPEGRKTAVQWITFIEREEERLRQLEESRE
jgi:tetratricopeptide (TPR) repeat protein